MRNLAVDECVAEEIVGESPFRGFAAKRRVEPLGRATSTARAHPPPGGRTAAFQGLDVIDVLGAVNYQAKAFG